MGPLARFALNFEGRQFVGAETQKGRALKERSSTVSFQKPMVLKSFEQARLRLHDRTNGRSLTLAGFEPTIGLVDDIGAPTATDHTVIPVPTFE
jgi:hypothetical protein